MARPVERGGVAEPRAPMVTALALLVLVGWAGPGAVAALQPVASPGTPGAGQDPWAALDRARRSLAAAGAEQAEFVQSYVPAGFSSGEEEHGRIALLLPTCLRWDYDEPFPKSFLLCDDQVWAWNPGDGRGQKGSLERESQPGLDLLLLPVEQLSGRYEARIDDSAGQEAPGRLTIHLEPQSEMAERTELTAATLVVDTTTDRLAELSYTDQEGNRTRFVLSGYRPLEEEGLFQAPKGIDWEDL